MGNSTLNVCGYITVVFFVILNVLSAILGIVAIGLASWYIATNTDSTIYTDRNLSGAILLIISGIFVVLICTTGIVGALFQWRPLLILYAFVLSITVILHIIGGIITIVFRDNYASGVDEEFQVAYSLFNDGDNASVVELAFASRVTRVQEQNDCCGYFNASDWIRWNPRALRENPIGMPVPPFYNVSGSGCGQCNPATEGCMTFRGTIENDPKSLPNISVSFNVTTKGCRDSVRDPIILQAAAGGVSSIIFAIIESLPIFLAIGLHCCITSARKTEVV